MQEAWFIWWAGQFRQCRVKSVCVLVFPTRRSPSSHSPDRTEELKRGESVTLVHWFQRRAFQRLVWDLWRLSCRKPHFSGYRDCLMACNILHFFKSKCIKLSYWIFLQDNLYEWWKNYWKDKHQSINIGYFWEVELRRLKCSSFLSETFFFFFTVTTVLIVRQVSLVEENISSAPAGWSPCLRALTHFRLGGLF